MSLLFSVGYCIVSVFGMSLDESPADVKEWDYRPADGAVAERTPPAFSWRPCEGAESYVLQIGKGHGFKKLVYEKSDIPWPAHCPPVVLEPGAYVWRYAAVDAAGQSSPWSHVRRFQIPADAAALPQPEVADLLQRMPESHPRLFFRPEDIPCLKELAHGALHERWETLLAKADGLIDEPPDTTEPPKYPEGMVRKSGEWREIWWGNRRRMIAVVDAAATLAFVYRITDEVEYGDAARDLLLAFAAWDPNGATNYQYNDEAAMPALYMASRAYSWAYPVFSDEDRAVLVEVMRERGRQAFEHLHGHHHLWRPYSSHSNRAWHFLGELAIAFHGEIPEAGEWLDYAMTVFYTAYPVWGDADGGWHEGTGYWSSYIGRFMYWAYVARAAFGIDVFERSFFRRTGYYGMYVLPPGSETGGFGDQAARVTSARIAPLMATLAANARNPHWQWYAEANGAELPGGYIGFLYAARASGLEAEPPAALPSSACFQGNGLAVMNTNLLDGKENVQVLMKSSPFGRQSHGFNANNAFVLNIGGQRALCSSGRRDIHGSPHHTEWMWHSRSDNAILVNGQGQIKHSAAATGEIRLFDTSPTVDVAVGEAAASYENLERWTRRIVFLKPHVVLIHDLLDAPEPATFQWTLHAPGRFELGENAASWTGDAGRVSVRFLEPGELVLTQNDVYEPPPATWTGWDLGEWHLAADAQACAPHREFITLIEVDQEQVEADVERTMMGRAKVTMALPEGEAEVVLGKEGFKVRYGEFRKKY